MDPVAAGILGAIEQLSENDAVRLADLLLYGAKNAGRNRVHAGA